MEVWFKTKESREKTGRKLSIITIYPQEDNTMLRYINDTSRKIYAFAMDQSTTASLGDTFSPSVQHDTDLSNSRDSITAQPDIFSDVGTFSVTSSMNFRSDTLSAASSYYGHSQESDFTADTTNEAMVGTGLWEWNERPEEKRRGSLETEFEDSLVADSTSGNGMKLIFMGRVWLLWQLWRNGLLMSQNAVFIEPKYIFHTESSKLT
jgi:hypothetical protein